jgi:hypothetical protein
MDGNSARQFEARRHRTVHRLTDSRQSISPDVAAVVARRTEGSPLFLVDLLRDLRGANLISNQDGNWALKRPLNEIESTLPDSISQMVARKIGKLTEAHRKLL